MINRAPAPGRFSISSHPALFSSSLCPSLRVLEPCSPATASLLASCAVNDITIMCTVAPFVVSLADAQFLARRVPAAGFASDDSPRTPVAVLAAPRSYGDNDGAEGDPVAINKTSAPPPKKQPHPQQYEYEYDADIDATFRAMEREATERPLPDYLSTTQAGDMMMMDRADLVQKMHWFYRSYDLAPGALHRAVSFVDRFLSAKKMIDRGEREIHLLGAVAVFTAAKYEDRNTLLKINADHVAMYAGCLRSQAVDKERELVAALGYRLSGPTAYTFVDHFLRHRQEHEVRSLAHHLANIALLDYRCVSMFLPSAVAASAILLARMVLYYDWWDWTAATPEAGYALEDLSDCIQAIYDMHENERVWPGCAQMMQDWLITTQFRYSLPPRRC